jgi:hypothetical protein
VPKRIDAGGQAEPIESRGHLVPSFAQCSGIGRSQIDRCCAKHAFVESAPRAYRLQRRSSWFNIRRGNAVC